VIASPASPASLCSTVMANKAVVSTAYADMHIRSVAESAWDIRCCLFHRSHETGSERDGVHIPKKSKLRSNQRFVIQNTYWY
jgi:hypothetical protein